MKFRVVLEYDPVAECYSAVCPELPGCTSAGETEEEARRGIEYAQKYKNVALEITLTAATYKVIEFMAEHAGADRVLFGTDQPMRDPLPQFGWMAYTHCSLEAKRQMFGLNMKKILQRVRW